MNNEIVSICIPVYNRERYLGECLLSVINQTYPFLEIIIVDDCSDDSSKSLIEKYAQDDDRIKYHFFNEHVGVSTVRNKLLELATGKYVMFIDSDDFYISKQSIEKAVNKIKSEQFELVCFGCNCYKENDGTYFDNSYFSFKDKTIVCDDVFKTLTDFSKRVYTTSLCNKVFLNSIIKKQNIIFPKDISIGEDYIFLMQYCAHIKKICCISDCLYTIRIHQSLSACNDLKYKTENHLKQIQFLYKCMPSHVDLRTSNRLFVYLLIRSYLTFNPRMLLKTWRLFNRQLSNEQLHLVKENLSSEGLSYSEIQFGKTIYLKRVRFFYFLRLFYLRKRYKNEKL